MVFGGSGYTVFRVFFWPGGSGPETLVLPRFVHGFGPGFFLAFLSVTQDGSSEGVENVIKPMLFFFLLIFEKREHGREHHKMDTEKNVRNIQEKSMFCATTLGARWHPLGVVSF